MRKILPILLMLVLIIAAGCNKNNDSPDTPKTIYQLKVSNDFLFETDKKVTVELKALANDNTPLKGVVFTVYDDYPENGGQQILSGVTDETGTFVSDYQFPAITQKVLVTTQFIGLPHDTLVNLENGELKLTLGGSQKGVIKSSGWGIYKSSLINFYYMGTFNSQGKPNYLLPQNYVVSSQLHTDLNNSFPEGHPISSQYLNLNNEYDFKLTAYSDVWVVFVSEGAGYKNVLGYYKYNLNNPPTSPAQIDSGYIIFPNVSFQGSGGQLQTGNQVYLGRFPANTGIGFFLIANGFSNGQVTMGNGVYYTNYNFNPESTLAKKKHSITLMDPARDIFLMGFEDLNRDGSSDNDFNDALFFIVANPIENVVTTNFPIPSYVGTDNDGDGIPNNVDEYPDDPQRAFNNYYPSKNNYGTLAFEDMWPYKADYDFNDMVIDYNINQVTNGNNRVVEIKSTWILRAMGASYRNGFGFQLGVAPNTVASVTGQRLTEGLVNLNANGTEAGQDKAVIMVFDDGYKILPTGGSGVVGVNTSPYQVYVEPDTIRVKVVFVQPQTQATVGAPPFNPFIFVNKNRGREIHLNNQPPTSLANTSLFSTYDDTSNPATGRYYRTQNNLPWAINIVNKFAYPFEKIPVTDAHLKFAPWAESSGVQYPDWYLDKSGYRDATKIYHATK
ncbi:MAG: LruC domain-containing protein [Bacteroidales bacterium]